ncbi:hypothetical protein HZA57_07265 [Candidatus Poribacteria bacterium]|nr:hypothetical protein [Candidatus Poribacteria bacterium]
MNRLRFFHVLALACSVLALAGCSTTATPGRLVRVAVLDGMMAPEAPEATETRQSVSGWWFGSTDRFDSGNASLVVAEAVSREFGNLPGVQVYPREDLRAYMAQKERVLRRAYPDLQPQERLQILEEQNPVDYGRSLEVDYVVSSRVSEARTTHNRTFHWWGSHVAFDLDVWETATGKKVWSANVKSGRLFSSQVGTIEEMARSLRREALRKDPFELYTRG